MTGLCVCVLCAGATNSSAGTRHVNTWLRSQIAGYERLTWHWQHVMGAAVTPAAAGVTPDALRRWQRLAHAARVQAQHPPHMAAFLCIHRYEGSWTDGGAPYWGGLQMNYGFQATYGSWLLRHKGTADHWTPLEQIWVAEKAVLSRGFWPWPNTARMCGLI